MNGRISVTPRRDLSIVNMIGHNTTPVALLSRFKAIKGLLSRWRGQQGEDIGLKFLEKQGLTLIERNFSCRYGELDLIMKDARRCPGVR